MPFLEAREHGVACSARRKKGAPGNLLLYETLTFSDFLRMQIQEEKITFRAEITITMKMQEYLLRQRVLSFCEQGNICARIFADKQSHETSREKQF